MSISLLIAPHRFAAMSYWQNAVETLVAPLQYLVDAPISLLHQLGQLSKSKQSLLAENAVLRAHQLLVEAKLQKLLALERENAELKALLQTKAQLSGQQVLTAQLLAVNTNQFGHEVWLDKGTQAQVVVGQPVLDAYGVLGAIIAANPLTSRVLLITDLRSGIPVQDSRNGLRAILAGQGLGNPLLLMNVPKTADIQVGDHLITSGLGGIYPAGYPVGVVLQVVNADDQRFLTVMVQPAAHVYQSRHVLLIMNHEAA